MQDPCELILQRPDNRFDVLAFIECRKYDYCFQRNIPFLRVAPDPFPNSLIIRPIDSSCMGKTRV